MAAALQPNYPSPPGIRPQTRTKVVEILAANANGCLAELGYTPGLIERVNYLETIVAQLKQQNMELKQQNMELDRNAKAWRIHADGLKGKCITYQSENVKLYEDNHKLVQDCDALRAQLAAVQGLCAVYEKAREMDSVEILKQYAALASQYSDAVRQLRRRAAADPNTRPVAPPQASGSQPPREIRPTTVHPQQPRRASAPMPQMHPPMVPQPQPMPQMVPSHSAGPSHVSHQRPYSWVEQPAPSLPPTPTSAPPISNFGSAYSTLVAAGPSYRRGSASTSTPPVPPIATPPMSALPLTLQNFASPTSHQAPPRTASSSSAGSQRTPVLMQHEPPPLPSTSAASIQSAPSEGGIPPAAPDSAPPEIHEGDAPTEVQEPPGPQEGGVPPEPQEPPPEPQESNSPPEAHEAITPPRSTEEAFSAESLNRASPGVDMDDEDPRKEAHAKKPSVKMEVDDPELAPQQTRVAENEGDMDVDTDESEDDEDDDGQDIEIGPDGLRTVADCVSVVFDSDEGLVCRFCMARYNADARDGVASEEPQGLVGATTEELAAHCEAEHGYAWGMLRSNV
ncbi:hypothetical protein C8R44DRAFT_76600 [Mycena epipterygia]|nr:hypothetical protein C8R44DRAFT_76600 [Mycena epipterygia]